uniref:HTH CENPB-type domain-containing protein n=1 Tax=Plectus sambesii TaxID=2011161 RepID=A0A914XQ42_9BILA
MSNENEANGGGFADPVWQMRHSYTIIEKFGYVARLNSGTSVHRLSQETGIDRKRLRDWKNDPWLASETNKATKRCMGRPRRPPFFPELNAKLIAWFKEQREKHITVTYKSLRYQIRKAELSTPLPANFKASDGYLFCWTKRHNIGRRCITHTRQADNREKREIAKLTEDFLLSLNMKMVEYEANHIYYMDEIPCYFDMMRDLTLHFKGSKNVDGCDTGNRKSRFTVALTVCADGHMAKALVIFRGLKKVPKVKAPKNIAVLASISGTMDTNIALKYIDKCFVCRGPYLGTTKSLLIWDSFGSHRKDKVLEDLRKKCRSEALILPPKTTAYLQPLDAALRNKWSEWFESAPPEYTRKGYRKRPSYQHILDMVSNAMNAIDSEAIKRAFRCCGIAAYGKIVPVDDLNERLQLVLSWKDQTVKIKF